MTRSFILREAVYDDVYRGLLDCLSLLSPVELSFQEAILAMKRRTTAGIHTFVAVTEGPCPQVVGTTSLFLEPKLTHRGRPAAHIEDVAVLDEYQGRGLGKMLVDFAISWVSKAHPYKVVLNCSSHNVDFYKKCGFHVTADRFMRMDV